MRPTTPPDSTFSSAFPSAFPSGPAPSRPTRRALLGTAGLGAGLLVLPRASALGYAANESLRIGVVGVGGRGAANLAAVSGETVAALCDVDAHRLAAALPEDSAVARFVDFREMLATIELDAVVISTPDHTHADVTVAALRRDLHVYCEKPLTHSIVEARLVTRLARERGAVTQMGTQIHAGDNYRRVVELVRSGVLGAVREVHVACGKNWGATERPAPAEAPAHLDVPLWLGPRQGEPYRGGLHPAGWRRYWPFGGGTLGDMASHYLDLPFWALALRAPARVETEGPEPHPFCAPTNLHVRWDFAADGDRAPLALHWYDGGRRPELWTELGLDAFGDGVLFVGEKGSLVADYGRYRLLPESDFVDFVPPEPSIPSSIGHHAEWIAACKGGAPTTCPFSYSGPLTETILLGVAAHRLGQSFTWNASDLRSPEAPGLDALLSPPRADGWELRED